MDGWLFFFNPSLYTQSLHILHMMSESKSYKVPGGKHVLILECKGFDICQEMLFSVVTGEVCFHYIGAATILSVQVKHIRAI